MTDKAESLVLSLLWHVVVVFGIILFGRYPAPEPPLLIIDFSMATAAAESGQTAAQVNEQTSLDASPTRSESFIEQQDVPEKSLEKPSDMPEKIIAKAKLTREKSKKHLRPTVENKEDVPPQPVAEGQEHQPASIAGENTPARQVDGDQSANSEAVSQSRKSAGSETPVERNKGDSTPNKSYDFEFVRKLIVKNLNFPATARRKGFSGKIVVTFHLKEDGQATDIALVESSGHDILDSTVVATIGKISPFPRPEAAAQIILPIVFHLR